MHQPAILILPRSLGYVAERKLPTHWRPRTDTSVLSEEACRSPRRCFWKSATQADAGDGHDVKSIVNDSTRMQPLAHAACALLYH